MPTPEVELLPAAPLNNVLPLLSIIVILLVESLPTAIARSDAMLSAVSSPISFVVVSFTATVASDAA